MSNHQRSVEKHRERQEKIIETWTKAIKDAKYKISKEYKEKRKPLEIKIKNLYEESQEIVNSSKEKERQLLSELNRVKEQRVNLDSASDARKTDNISLSIDPKEKEIDLKHLEARNTQVQQISNEMLKEINGIMTKYTDRILYLDNVMYVNARAEKEALRKSTNETESGLKSLYERERTLLDKRVKVSAEYIRSKERIDTEIEKINEQLNELRIKEIEAINKTVDDGEEKQLNELKNEMTSFISKFS